MAASNPGQKAAMKRLMRDLEELKNSPVANVSASPLENNMLEWHCNFLYQGTIHHIILFFNEKYPYESPSAEFVPSGYQFSQGATRRGKKGTQVCLSIFSDFLQYHPEWKDEKGIGWSPGYTVQTILLNLVSFLAEAMPADDYNSYHKSTMDANCKLCRGFTCTDCGHTHQKPFPPFPETEEDGKQAQENVASEGTADQSPQIIDYIGKEKFQINKPKSDANLFGFGLVKSGSQQRPTLASPCEFLTFGSYDDMRSTVGKTQSILKDTLSFFLPLYIHPLHGNEIKGRFEKTMLEIARVLPGCSDKTPIENLILKTLPNFMTTTVVEFSKGTQHTSDNHLNGYFSLHRLFLWATKTYPKLQEMVDTNIQSFISSESNRSKKSCPNIGEWLMYLSVSSKLRWQDAAEAYLDENNRRNVMWYVKDHSSLGFSDTSMASRLSKTLTATLVSRKLLAFQVLFLDIAMPTSCTKEEIIERYDKHCGFPSQEMVAEMKKACETIKSMKTYADWYKVLKLPVPAEEDLNKKLVQAVEFAIKTDGYHMTGRNQGGWADVLRQNRSGPQGWRSSHYASSSSERKRQSTVDDRTGHGRKTDRRSKHSRWN